jgi:hypothetical protein
LVEVSFDPNEPIAEFLQSAEGAKKKYEWKER